MIIFVVLDFLATEDKYVFVSESITKAVFATGSLLRFVLIPFLPGTFKPSLIPETNCRPKR
jgi:hypothetical protein